MKKKKYGWPKRCLSLMCVLVLISMIILQSVPVTYASAEMDVFTSEPEDVEVPPDEGIQGGNQLVNDAFTDGNSENSQEQTVEEPSDTPPDQKPKEPSDSSSQQDSVSESEQETDTEISDGQRSDITAGENLTDENKDTLDNEQPDSESNPQQENEDIWKNSVVAVELTGDYAKDLTTIARTQLGVQENKDNFITTEDGEVHCYSRYGQWAGDAYEEWSAAFVNFCAHYANIPQQYLPKSEKVSQLAETLNSRYGLARDAYNPKEGDLIFFQINLHTDGNSQIQMETPAHVGIVTGEDGQYVYTIEGNCDGEVKSQQYEFDSVQIYGYLNMDEVKEAAGLIQDESQPGEEITPIPEEAQPTEEVTPTPSEAELTEVPFQEPVMQYEDENVIINIEAEPEVIPEDSTLSVTPIVADENDADKQAQYNAVADKLAEKAKTESYNIAGFLAYDISFIGADGNKTEPFGDVKVSMNYKKAQAPKNITTDENTELKIMHLEENNSGEVQQVTDLSDEQVTNGSVQTIETNEAQEVEKVEFNTNSFSTFAITWVSADAKKDYFDITVHYVDEMGNELDGVQTDNLVLNDKEKIVFSEYAQGVVGYDYIRAKINNREDVNYVIANGNKTRTCKFYNASGVVETLTYTGYNAETQTADIYLIYRISEQPGTQAILSHEKYIKKNTDGTYNITLNASGTVGSETRKKKLDIVLLMDVSGSMGDDKKLDNAQSAVENLTNTLNNRADKIDVRYKLVTFSDKASIKTSWISGADLDNAVSRLAADDGTNYDDGLSKAADAVKINARTDADKIVIFLTDGEPTYYNKGNEVDGLGYQINRATYDAAIKSAKLITCNRFMAIGIGLGNIDWPQEREQPGTQPFEKPATGEKLLQNVTNETNATVKDTAVDLKNPSDLPKKFQDIAEDILKFACKDVTITDTLSDYVDLTDASKIELKIAKKTNDAYTKQGDYLEISLNDEELLSGGKTVTIDGKSLGTAHYDNVNKKVIWSLGADYKLEENLYYYISITNVRPSTLAETTFVNNIENHANGYGENHGDENTDASEDGFYGTSDGTSSGQEGFPSNKSATVKYTETKNGNTTTEDYSVPVVQVDTTKLFTDVNFTKIWKDANNANGTRPEYITLTLQYRTKNDSNSEWKNCQLESKENPFTLDSANQNEANLWKTTITNLPLWIDNQEVEYQIVESPVTGYDTEQTDSTTITNKARWKIIKQDSKPDKDGNYKRLSGAEFILSKRDDSTDQKIADGISGSSDTLGVIEWTPVEKGAMDKLNGSYILTETKAPKGYVRDAREFTLEFVDGILTKIDNKIIGLNEKNEIVCFLNNKKIEELPATGGTGTFLFAISGAAIMTGALLLYINKRKEEETV